MSAVLAEKLATLYREKGLRCEIEAGPIGLVVYASTRVDAERVARDLLFTVRPKDPRARTEPAQKDEDEGPETAWWATVEFDWGKF